MFELISQYHPQKVDIETKLIPFIPEFIPAVGDIDAFIKIPRPDGIDDGVGLLVLDEPASVQTDPGALELKLQRSRLKNTYHQIKLDFDKYSQFLT